MPFTEFPISTVEDDLEMLGRIGRDNLRICLDTGHAAIFKGKDVASAVRMIGDKLKAVHIHDNMGKEDEHLIPGDGIIDWNAFADALREIGYTGVISLETSPKHKNHPKEKWEERELALKKIVDGIAEKASKK
jgi:sugar phosphate isomerase/epimerase